MNGIRRLCALLLLVAGTSAAQMPTARFFEQRLSPFIPGRGGKERSVVRAYVLSMQRREAYDDEMYESINEMCDEIGCPLNFYEDTILPFEDTSSAAAAA